VKRRERHYCIVGVIYFIDDVIYFIGVAIYFIVAAKIRNGLVARAMGQSVFRRFCQI